MARGYYKVSFSSAGYSKAGPSVIAWCQCAVGKPVQILEVHVTDGDQITNQQLECQIVECTTVGSATGTTPTPVPEEPSDQAAGSTWATILATNTLTGSNPHVDEGWPLQGGFHWTGSIFVPAISGPGTSNAGVAVVLVPTPSSFKLCGWIGFREMG